jgi:hypothetical protein
VPFSLEKVLDIVGVHLSPPEKTVDLCVDEKRKMQVLGRTLHMLGESLGCVDGVAHHHERHGAITLFPALNIVNSDALTQYKRRHRHREHVQILQDLQQKVPRSLGIHIVVNNPPPRSIHR